MTLAEVDKMDEDKKINPDPSKLDHSSSCKDEEPNRIKELEKRVEHLEKELHRAAFLRLI